MTKRIVYDGLNLALKSGTGVATYARGLLDGAAALGYHRGILHSVAAPLPRDAALREIVLFDDDGARKLGLRRRLRRTMRRVVGAPFGLAPLRVPLSGAVVAKSFNAHLARVEDVYAAEDLFGRARGHFQSYGGFMQLSLDRAPDLLHCTYPLPLANRKGASIYTLHDLVPLKLPYLSDDNKRYYYRLLRTIARQADHIVTVSETSRRDIIEMLGVDESRITNTYQAVEVPARLRDKPEAAAATELGGLFGLDWKQYLLFYGALEPKKNVMRLMEAYLAAGTTLPLVIVGGTGWRSDDEKTLLDDPRFGFYERQGDRFQYRRQIRRFDFVSLPMLVNLIRGARAVVFPSLYEGFGLPVLEAMQLGTAVISSTEGSIPEIAGKAAMLVDPYDTDALRQAIAAISGDDGLCAQLEQAGPAHAATFSRERYHAALADLYGRLLG